MPQIFQVAGLGGTQSFRCRLNYWIAPPPAALPSVDNTKARIPTAADMMIPTEAKVKPVKVFWKRVVLVALPKVPKSIPFATVCRFAAMIKAIRTQITRAVIAITSAILILFTSPYSELWLSQSKYKRFYMESAKNFRED